jgi:MSHA pilin protein MshD
MSRSRSLGVTLIELVVFIVIVGVAMAGMFAAFNTMNAASADPQSRKQVLAIAESLMDEVTLMPFTYCDPDDANAATATGPGIGGTQCATTSEDTTIGPEASEDRYGTVLPFDNVSDYNGFSLPAPPGIKDINNNAITGLSGYSASVTVSQAALASGVDTVPAADSLKVTVVVTGPNGVTATLESYRTRYAPNTVP